ncbi:enoyl-CoA hydratase-related protein [Sphingomonas immobilis]|uniref:Enoyl-CoA hydratase-related protein n=1 Tax=Sphingomonas immobilis TaxID=3063997 RepID=A0ABT8ZXK3_9SPHN|nr:enoyl-CoA hydratase-related protein [Sphingomonas sp. CA1-15]MDO7842303.1 enoyl-CoA hydratase-related protein [Sphingomonas sp. CA1-15]
MSDIVRFEVIDRVGVITLNRPDKLNALDDAMHPALDEAWVAAHTDPSARAIVLTGAGRGFCAGADLTRLDRFAASRGSDFDLPAPGVAGAAYRGLGLDPDLATTYTFPLATPKPVIGAINGACIGIAFAIAMTCDVRFASTTARFGAAFPQRGIHAEAGIAWLLPRIVGRTLAADLLMSGRVIGADEALRIGMVSRIEEPDALLDAAIGYAREIAINSAPQAVAIIKQQLFDGCTESFGDAARKAHDLLLERFASDDFVEGIASFREKRPPRFADL